MADALLYVGAAAAIAGVALLRYAWSLPKRSRMFNAIAWGLWALAIALGWASAGMWGVSVETLIGMVTAIAIMAHAASTSPPSKAKASNRRVKMLPEAGEPLGLGRRILTFLIVIGLGMFAAAGFAVGARWIAALAGAGEADANVIGLFVMPLAWTFLAFFMMMAGRRRQMLLVGIGLASALPAAIQGGAL
ncbi:hypothetical protein [Sphingomonas montanisoli]|uniref:Uncharacterized protein n=1 Tax=Sphingomonas montanisoli TaxID=2606412 RepID=A0A5D9BZZ0_9SPHN|nr:hypothetical protein [Sphingomonas montanisoli]TZG25054.1 hypothetical protein FYJ91_17475 [Sphingomonas montanisoli]